MGGILFDYFKLKPRVFHTELVEISDFYGEKELTKCCENLLKSLMTVENICDIYGKAVQYNVEVAFTLCGPLLVII